MSSEPESTTMVEAAPSDRSKFQLQVSLAFWGTVVGTLVIAFLVGRFGIDLGDKSLWSQLLVLLSCGFAQGIVLLLFAYKSGNPLWWLVAPIAIVPVANWLAYLIVAGYEHTPGKPKEESIPVIVWIPMALLPCGCGVLLQVLRPEYVGQLLYGPPLGANIPGIGIPCGWPILAILVLILGLHEFSLWLGIGQIRLKGAWLALLIVVGVVVLSFPAIWLVVLGPAAVEVYKQFYGG